MGCREERPGELGVPRGNLVFLSVDTTRADHLSVYGYERPTTPTLERIARDAIVFDQAIAAAPSTAPSHMSMFTGLYPSIHGVMNLGFEPGENVRFVRRSLPEGIRTLAQILRDQGWTTGAFTGGGNTAGALGFDRGFDLYVDSGSGLSGHAGGERVDPSRALEWIRSAAGSSEPFFAFLHTYIPHSPYVPPPEFAGRFDPGYRGPIPGWKDLIDTDGLPAKGRPLNDRFWETVNREDPGDIRHLVALYDEEIRYADDLVDRLFSEFFALGLDENTVFVIVSDHGEQFGEHGDFEHHGEVWEELIRVPLLVLTPSTRNRGFRVAQPVSGIEIFPTLLDLLGLPPDPQCPMRSLVPRLERRQPWGDDPLVSEFMSGVRDEGGGYWSPRVLLRSVRTTRYKLIQRWRDQVAREEIFDLVSDPSESTNVERDLRGNRVVVELRRESDAVSKLGERLRLPMRDSEADEELRRQLRDLGYIK